MSSIMKKDSIHSISSHYIQTSDLPQIQGRYCTLSCLFNNIKNPGDVHLKTADLPIPSVLQTLTDTWINDKKK